MVEMAGTLAVRLIKGRKGVFAVGDLITEVGNFKVKDPMLDQFDEGEYRGRFHIARIYQDSYIYYGRVVTEMRIQLAGYVLDNEEIKPVPEAPAEPDPADHHPVSTPAPVAPSLPTVSVPAEPRTPAQHDQGEDPDLALFGTEIYQLIQTGAAVKLDATLERNTFRAQVRRLRAMGFSPEVASQSWKRDTAA